MACSADASSARWAAPSSACRHFSITNGWPRPWPPFAGLAGGLIREIIPTKEDIWDFGPFTFLNVPRWIKRMAKGSGPGWETLPLAGCVGLELVRQATIHRRRAPQWLFHLDAQNWWQSALLVLATVMAVAVPIKIWNNTRIQMNLEQHQKLLLQARMAALSSQINPHFLFNTLNTVSSLIRYDPDQARIVVLKLGNILRRLLRKHDTFVPLQDELAFVDDYLDIEVARFGRDNLQIVKEVDPQTLEAFVPSMLLQPIVENAIKHGLAARLDGGQITIRTAWTQGRLVIEVEDNGVGISQERMPQIFDGGIGISNVQRAAARAVRGRFPHGRRQPGRAGHAHPHRSSRNWSRKPRPRGKRPPLPLSSDF